MSTAPQLAGPPTGDNWDLCQALPCALEVKLRVPHFTVGDLLQLQSGITVATAQPEPQDVPLEANGAPIAFGEFETLTGKLAVRLTRLA